MWLTCGAEIEPYTASTVYEEYDGQRTTAAIDNEQGGPKIEENKLIHCACKACLIKC